MIDFDFTPYISFHETTIALGILGRGGDEFKLAIEFAVLATSPSHHWHKEVTMPGTPVGIPIDFQSRVRIVRLNLGERPARAVKTKEGTVLVKIVIFGDMFSPVGRQRILAGFSNLH